MVVPRRLLRRSERLSESVAIGVGHKIRQGNASEIAVGFEGCVECWVGEDDAALADHRERDDLTVQQQPTKRWCIDADIFDVALGVVHDVPWLAMEHRP